MCPNNTYEGRSSHSKTYSREYTCAHVITKADTPTALTTCLVYIYSLIYSSQQPPEDSTIATPFTS